LVTYKKLRHFSVTLVEKAPLFSLQPKSSFCLLDKFKSRTRSLRSPCVNKLDSDEEQLASNVISQSAFSACSHWSSESEFLSLTVWLFGGFDIENASLWRTELIADSKSGYFTVCLDLGMIPAVINKSNNVRSGLLVPSKARERRKAFVANHFPILWEASHKLHNNYKGPNFYLGHPLYTQNKVQNVPFNKRSKLSPLRFTTNLTEDIRMIWELLSHD